MNLKQWCTRDENIRVALSKEYFNLEVGLPHDRKKIARLEEAGGRHSRYFLQHFKKPRILYIDSVGGIISEKTYKLQLQLTDLRKKKICEKVSNKTICWTNWREFANKASDQQRKKVFDAFIRKTPIISPVIKDIHDTIKNTYAEYGLTPLGMYYETEQTNFKTLNKVITQLSKLKQPFKKDFRIACKRLFKKEPSYYDDFYFTGNRLYGDLVPAFKHINPLKTMYSTMKQLGFSRRHITVDDKNRKAKYPSPFCSFVKIPTDIRVSYKFQNPLNTTQAIYHEFGHAMHASNIRKNLPYWQKYSLSNSLSETFSTLFEEVITDPDYLVKQLKVDKDSAEEFIRRATFDRIYGIVFYCANSRFKINFWKNNIPFSKTDAEYAKQIKYFTGLRMPGAYWKLHHILPETSMYVPSYLLAFLRSFEIHNSFKEKYGDWWTNKKAGTALKKIMAPGTQSPVGDFTKLDARKYVKTLC